MARKTTADEIIRLHSHGLASEEIAKFLNIDTRFVKMVIEHTADKK